MDREQRRREIKKKHCSQTDSNCESREREREIEKENRERKKERKKEIKSVKYTDRIIEIPNAKYMRKKEKKKGKLMVRTEKETCERESDMYRVIEREREREREGESI